MSSPEMGIAGASQIVSQRLRDGSALLFLPLPPSTNARMRPVIMGGHARDILTTEARAYMACVGRALSLMGRSLRDRVVDDYRPVEMWFVLPRTNSDNHNFFKCLCDAIEDGGLAVNDKYIMPQVRGIWHDARAPQVVVRL